MADLRDHLSATLSTSYTIERELGGGGMSRVFVAEERALGRRVVIKLLPMELAGGVSAERFAREVRLAANLQHPCIVPVLSTGAAGDMPYYTMPLVEGDSLRARLSRGPVPVSEAVKILRDMASAMAYAHERGIVHRDIKPENVLLSRGYAVVSDFGIAKALEGARTLADAPSGATITQLGAAIGTPAYMAPEQAAGDPGTNHRADIYAWGMVAHELLGGAHPFSGRTSAQALLAAQMSEKPRALGELRTDLPPQVVDLVMRCVEKDPAQRPQSAEEIARTLDAAVTPGEGRVAAMSRESVKPPTLARALGIYAAAFVAVLILAKAAIVGIGLPSWVFVGAIAVMLLGLPLVLFTWYVKLAAGRGITVTPGGTATQATLSGLAAKANPHVSWRRTTLGGAWAVGAFAALVAAYMVLRALGIGPAGSLLASGVIKDRDQLLVADFSVVGTDTLLARAVAEAIRTDLGQSNIVTLVPASVVHQTLQLMQKPATTPIDTGTARVIATRTGIKAVLGGDIALVGTSYLLTARLISPSSGDVLAAFRENADDQRDLLPAVERLSRSLRAKLGESLRRIQADPALEQVTTSSLEALRLYAQGVRLGDELGDVNSGFALLEQAVALDSTFAMAWRKLGVWGNNRGDANGPEYARRAVENADRLPTDERFAARSSYLTMPSSAYDVAEGMATMHRGLEADSNNSLVRTNLGIQQGARGELDSAIANLTRAARQGNQYGLYHLAAILIERGRRKESDSVLAEAHRVAPSFPYRGSFDAGQYVARGQLDSAEGALRGRSIGGLGWLANLQMARGELRAATTTLQRLADSASAKGDLGSALDAAATSSWISSTIRNAPAAAAAELEAAEKRYPIDKVVVAKRPYYQLAAAYVAAGRVDRARQLIREGDQQYSPGLERYYHEPAVIAKGLVALAEGHPREAAATLNVRSYCGGVSPRMALAGLTIRCPIPFLAVAYDRAGDADSARAALEQYVNGTSMTRVITDGPVLAQSLQRLGELYEAKGDKSSAIKYYARLLDVWKNADAELKPRMEDLQRRVARLSDTERK